MKLLSDFDGVWTDPRAEALAQGEIVDRALIDGVPEARRAAAEAWIRDARAATLRAPTRYGWASGRRLSAFADEDPFIAHSALLHYLETHRAEDALADAMRAGVLAGGFESLDAFGGASHGRAVERVTAARGPGILPAAAAAAKALLDAGIDVVVVSNSTPDKLLHWFEHAGVPAARHPECRARALRIRGSARKFVLGERRRGVVDLGDTHIEIDRPSYEEILVDERPDGVVGDVFSLDLALPLALKREGGAWSALKLYWLIYPYTPEWLVREVEAHAAGEVEPIEGGIASLARRLTGAEGSAA